MRNIGQNLASNINQRQLLLPYILIIIFLFIVNSNTNHAFALDAMHTPESDVSALEMRFFAHNYSTETLDKRLDRLDNFVFGVRRTGSDQERIAALVNTVPDLLESSVKTPDQSTSQSDKTSNSIAGGDNSQSDENNKADNVPPGNYPTVTSLEQQILGQTYENTPVQQRLARLETKVFGKPSQADDLSGRVDSLEQYLNSQNTQRQAYTTPQQVPTKWNSQSSGLTQPVGLTQPLGLTQQVSNLEMRILGEVHRKDKLTSRLSRLEKKVFPHQPPETFAPIAARINRLQAAVPESNQNTASKDNNLPVNNHSENIGEIQPFTSSSSSAAPYQPYNQQSSNTDTFNTSNNPPKKHSFLHKLGQVVDGAGSIAIRTLGSMSVGSYYGNYGYGGYSGYGSAYPGYGYNYSPYGFGSSSIYGGGYGMSPFSSGYGMSPFGAGYGSRGFYY